jgi:hypothetical protein
MKPLKQEYRVGIGASTMLTIFVVLCLATLSLLALSGARGDAALSGRALEMTRAYYEASDRAQRLLAQVDGALAAARAGAADQAAYEALIETLQIEGVSLAFEAGELSFELDAGGGRALSVALSPAGLGEMPRYTLTRYALVGGALWTGEADRLNLFD